MMTSASSWFVVRCSLWRLKLFLYLYRCWVWVNQIMTYKINKLYLVVQYVDSHVLGGQCRVKAELMLSTSTIA